MNVSLGSGDSIELVVGRVSNSADVAVWFESLLPLAVRRSVPLLAMSGIPWEMAARPIGLLSASRSVLSEIQAAFRAPSRLATDRIEGAVAQGLGLGFEKLRRTYGPQPTADLVAWLLRNEADWALKEYWWSWWRWLHDVAVDRVQLKLSPKSTAMVMRIVSTTMGEEADAAYRQCEAQARRVGLSATERRLLGEFAETNHGQASADVVASMGLARKREVARHTVLLLRSTLSQDEWGSLGVKPQAD